MENRRTIRETQRKDSITSCKESKRSSGEINKQPRVCAALGGGGGRVEAAWRDLRMGGEKNSRMVSRTTFLTMRAALGNFVLLPRGIFDSKIERFNWKAIPRFFE